MISDRCSPSRRRICREGEDNVVCTGVVKKLLYIEPPAPAIAFTNVEETFGTLCTCGVDLFKYRVDQKISLTWLSASVHNFHPILLK